MSAVVVIDLWHTSLLTTSSGTWWRRSVATKVWRRSCGVNAKPTRRSVRATNLSTADYFIGAPISPPQRLTKT